MADDMTNCFESQKDDTFSLMAAANRQVNGYISDCLNRAGAGNLAPSHGDIFNLLFSEGDVRMGEIAEKIERDPSTVTVLVNKLKRLGYVDVYRDEFDRRVTKVRLTKKGEGFKSIFQGVTNDLAHIQERVFSEQERKTLKEMLEKMRDAYSEERNRV